MLSASFGDDTIAWYANLSSNSAPSIDLKGTELGFDFATTFTESGPAVNISDAAATITDLEDTELADLKLVVSANPDGADETITVAGAAFALNADNANTGTVGSTTFQVTYVAAVRRFTVTKNGGGTAPIGDLEALLRGITYENTAVTPTTTARAIEITASDGTSDSAVATATISILASNVPPTLTSFAAVIDTTNEDTEVELTFAEFAAQGDEADIDGTVTAFVVQAVSSGTLTIGSNAGAATPFVVGANDTIDASNNAYWTGDQDANGTLNALTVLAEDDDGALSSGAVTAQVQIVPAAVYDFSAATFTAVEGDVTNSTSVVIVTRSANTTGASSVQVELSAGAINGATVGTDFTPGPITVIFADGDTSQTVLVQLLGDSIVELDETIDLTLSSPNGNGNIGTTQSTATLTMTNDDNAVVSINAPSETEGTAMGFSVTISNPVDVAVTAGRATQDGTATTADSDYAALALANAQLFAAGSIAALSIPISTTTDNKVELNETLDLVLSTLAAGGRDVTFAGGGATLSGTGTIENDDNAQFTVNSASGNEDDGPITFTVTLSNPVDVATSVDVSTSDGTALLSDSDYTQLAGLKLNFAAGVSSQTFDVLPTAESKLEPDETFSVTLSNVVNAGRNVTAGGVPGTGTIVNEDLPLSFTISDVTQAEGNIGTTAFVFNVALSSASGQTITVNYATAPGTAIGSGNPKDYTPIGNSTLWFAPGETNKTITVGVTGDTLSEIDETFFVNLSNPSNGVILDGQAIGTITNDDVVPIFISIDDVTLREGGAGTTAFDFTVSLMGPASTQAISVGYQTANGTATTTGGAKDYVRIANSTLTFLPGELSKTITVSVYGDTLSEPNETFFVNLSNPVNAILADSQGLGTILNDEVNLIPVAFNSMDNPIVPASKRGTFSSELTLTEGDPLFVDIGWGNTGPSATSGTFRVNVSISGGGASFDQIRSTPVALFSGSWQYDLDFGFLSAGNYTITMTIDADNTQFETNEADNVFTRNITVSQLNTGGATPLSVPVADINTATASTWGSVTASIGTAGDFDVYSFTLAAASGVFLDIDANDTGLSSLDSDLVVLDAAGTVVGGNVDGFDFQGFDAPAASSAVGSIVDAGFLDPSFYLDLASGSYFVAVGGAGTSTGDYELRALADTTYSATVPVFESRPGSADTVYLDFDGHSATDAWGTYTADGFDFDGNSATHSPAERLAMQNLFRTMEEDYSPFDINVTTMEPLSFIDGDDYRMVVTDSDSTIVLGSSGTLGVAIGPSYGTGGSLDDVGFTFADNFNKFTDAGISGAIMAAALEQGNTSSHEFGHALGLRPFNSMPGNFAGNADILPDGIMATLDFGLNREIWQSGLADAGSGTTVSQDDVAVIIGGANTFPYRPDDHDGTFGTATVLTPIGNTFPDKGIIERLTDADYFSFVTSGDTTVTASVDDYISNLDIELLLYDSSFVQIGSTSDPANSFDASIFAAGLVPGTYYVEVRSDGEVGEQGQFSLDIESVGAALPGAHQIQVDTEIREGSGVEPLFTEAINRWDASWDAVELANVDAPIVSLPGQMVGRVFSDTISLDPTVAGHGWFIALTAGNNSEFETPENRGDQDRMDSLSVLMREVGHRLEMKQTAGPDDLLVATLASSVRIVPAPDVPTGIALFARFLNGFDDPGSPAVDVAVFGHRPFHQSQEEALLEASAEWLVSEAEATLAVSREVVGAADSHRNAHDDKRFSSDELVDEELLDVLAQARWNG